MRPQWGRHGAPPRAVPLYGKQMVAVQAGGAAKTAVLLGSKRLNAEGFSVHLSAQRAPMTMGESVDGCFAPMKAVEVNFAVS